jgi:hypothetical protein
MKKNLFIGLVIYVIAFIFPLLLINNLLSHLIIGIYEVLRRGFSAPADIAEGLLFAVTYLVPIILLIVYKNLKTFMWGSVIVIIYAIIDMVLIKRIVTNCSDLCGVENIFFIGLSILSIVLTVIAYLVLRITNGPAQIQQ